jgi:hypothetical protein
MSAEDDVLHRPPPDFGRTYLPRTGVNRSRSEALEPRVALKAELMRARTAIGKEQYPEAEALLRGLLEVTLDLYPSARAVAAYLISLT